VSCSRQLLEAVAALSASEDALVHTHASENRDEVEIVRRLSGGFSNLEYLAHIGLATSRLCTAHCVWATEHEQVLLAERDVKVLHCPGSNLKLGSGIAPVPEMRARGVCVSIGADGAACNNRLDMFDEMRLAATLQSVRLAPGALTARDALWMATRDGARTLGLENEIGIVAPGYRADLIVVDRRRPHVSTSPDPWTAIVYAARGTDVRWTIVDGDLLVDEFELTRLDQAEVTAQATEAARALASRAGV
jgi:5-methylthioadenosine/S-adenosylhomocysteine deaminase